MKNILFIVRIAALVCAAVASPGLILGGFTAPLIVGFILFFVLSRGAQNAFRESRRMPPKEAKQFIWAIVAGCFSSALSASFLWSFTGVDSGAKEGGVLAVLLPVVAGVTIWLVYAYKTIQRFPEAPTTAAPVSPSMQPVKSASHTVRKNT